MDRVWHLLIPSVLGATGGIAILSRYVRSQMLEVEGQDYVRTARAKGSRPKTSTTSTPSAMRCFPL